MIKIKIKFFPIIVFLISMSILPSFLYAESDIMLQDTDIEVETIPRNPEPYQNVTINLISYSTDLNKAMIKWQSGSKTIMSGFGKKSYTFKSFGPNTTTIFNITITPANSFNNITKQVLITPSEVEVIWEAVDSYTPPFYKGKSFVSREGLIKVVAMPNTNTIKQGKGNITYTWSSNDETIQSASGYGKDSYIFRNSILNDNENITVVASSIDESYRATKTLYIPTVSPKILFYKKSPTEGVLYNKALTDNYLMSEDEMTIVAEPYFLELKNNKYDFNYKWQINGSVVETPTKKTELTIKPSSRGGYATISLYMENTRTLFQQVTGQLKLNL